MPHDPHEIDERGGGLPHPVRVAADVPTLPADVHVTTDCRNCLLLAVVVAALWIACWPFANVPVNDDFTYAWTVKRFVETGRFTFNGWSTALLGIQAIWAWPFVKAFGFSHDTLRFSVLPWAIVCAGLTYALHRRFGIVPIWSLFATLLLVASPIFTPWSASFMTDVPGLTLTVAMLLTFTAMRSATSVGRVAGFAALFAVLGICAGSVRQSAIPLAAVAYAYELWHRRRQPKAFAAVFVIASLCGAAMLGMMRWAAAQDFYLPEKAPYLGMLPIGVWNLCRLFLDGMLYALPLLFALIPVAVPSLRTRAWTLAAALFVIGAAAVSSNALFRAPWTGNTIMPTGMTEDWIDAPGRRPIVMGDAVRVALAACVAWTIALGLYVINRDGTGWWSLFKRRWRSLDATSTAIGGMLLLAFAYLCLLLPRATYGLIFDRYLLVVIPIASVAIGYAWRERLKFVRPAAAAWALLVLFALTGVAFTFDHFAELRARLRVASLLEGEGVARQQMVNSIGFDAWTQLEAAGHFNDERIEKPAGAYKPDPLAKEKAAIYWFLPQLPAIDPRVVVMNVRSSEEILAADRFVTYQTILPPRHRLLIIRTLPPLPAVPQETAVPNISNAR